MVDQYLERTVHYGAFKEALDRVVDVMRSEYAGSIIIRGNPGSGKKTLVREAREITNVRCVTISRYFYNEDHAAMKAVVNELGRKTKASHISDLMDEIRESAKGDEKLVIVLMDIEEFCRKRSCLLYNLTNLIHTNPNKDDKGLNLTLIGLTARLDWAENIEKRVRSRLNANCINLMFPYTSQTEFLEFASEMLDGYPIDGDLQEHLEYIYHFSNRSIRTLKKFLYNICTTNEEGQLQIELDPKSWTEDYQLINNNLLRARLRYLTLPQLDLMKAAVFYCASRLKSGFTLGDLTQDCEIKSYKSLDLTSDRAMRDVALLMKLRLLKPAKFDQVISDEAVFYPAATPIQFRAIIEGDRSLQCSSTDALWKKIPERIVLFSNAERTM